MKIRDLRIGNILLIDGVIEKVREIRKNEFSFDSKGIYWEEWFLQWAEQVSITNDILNAKFKKDYDFSNKYSINLWEVDKNKLCFIRNFGDVYSISFGLKTTEISSIKELQDRLNIEGLDDNFDFLVKNQ